MLRQIRMMSAVVAVAACATGGPPTTVPVPIEVEQPDEPVPDEALKIGLIVSNTGSAVLKQYAEMVLAGAQVAGARGADMREVELVIRDDGGTPSGAAFAVQELEREGVKVIVGPLVDEALLAAVRARSNEDVMIISPTAVSQPIGVRNAYALNVVDTRGAEALGEYARLFTRVGVLYSTMPESSRQARAFINAYGDAGIITDTPFPGGGTNLTDQLRRLREDSVQAVFFPASDRELQVVLPQIEYAGFDGVQMLGNETWTSDAARRLPQRVLEGAIVAMPLLQSSDSVAWRDFVNQYETMHRRSLTNPVPALGHDATALAVNAALTGSTEVHDFRGATGILSLEAGHVTRRPFLVRIVSGRPVPIN